jgi:hypothetical protein
MIHVATMKTTCEACPVQIEGTLTDGRYFYFRSRHRQTTLSLGPDPYGAVEAGIEAEDGEALTGRGFAKRVWPVNEETGRHPASYLEPDRALQLLDELLAQIEEQEAIHDGS